MPMKYIAKRCTFRGSNQCFPIAISPETPPVLSDLAFFSAVFVACFEFAIRLIYVHFYKIVHSVLISGINKRRFLLSEVQISFSYSANYFSKTSRQLLAWFLGPLRRDSSPFL